MTIKEIEILKDNGETEIIPVYYCDDCGAELNEQGGMWINTHSEKEYCVSCMDDVWDNAMGDPSFDAETVKMTGYKHWEYRLLN